MSFPLGVFQIFFHMYERNAPIGTFPSRSAADVYWRRLQEAAFDDPNGAQSYPIYRQHSRSFMLNNWNYWHGKPSLRVSGTIPIILSNHGESGTTALLPYNEQCPDNLNGGTFYIRSALERNLFWYYNPKALRIEISGEYKTKFTVRRKTPLPFECRPEDDILIGEDDINVFVTTPEWEGENVPDVMIVKNANKLLVPASVLSLNSGGSDEDVARVVEAGVFKFSMFDRGFGVMDSRSWDGKKVFVCARVNGGERWEFVQ